MKKLVTLVAILALAVFSSFGEGEHGVYNFTGGAPNMPHGFKIDGTLVTSSAAELNQLDQGVLSVTGDVTLANGATIDEATADNVRVTTANTNAELGVLILESDNPVAKMSDGDYFDIRFKANDSTNEKTSYATIRMTEADLTGDTEDGSILGYVFINGLETKVLTVDASGVTVNNGTFVGNGESLTNLSGAVLTVGSIPLARLTNALVTTTGGPIVAGTNWTINTASIATLAASKLIAGAVPKTVGSITLDTNVTFVTSQLTFTGAAATTPTNLVVGDGIGIAVTVNGTNYIVRATLN
jgi:hypothetical protein